ncbi:MAG: rRNA maturation RNase YbeY [Rhodospirillales bacterium]
MATRADILVSVECDGWDAGLADADALCRTAALAALDRAGLPLDGAEISILLTDDAEVRALNRDYRKQDKPTNVLSFAAMDGDLAPMPDGSLPLGDIVLAFETVGREAGEAGISLADHATHMVVHGTLHLLQYDHVTDAEAEVMESLETAILAGLGIADPYARETI